ncbi:DUF1559 family PulG-like putative transporter [Novipirellula aureliae]|nr:DUF1559 domain-containing protein [Novipirellula aureliae]
MLVVLTQLRKSQLSAETRDRVLWQSVAMEYPPWITDLAVFRCPSDSRQGVEITDGPPIMPTKADEHRGLRWADGHTVFTGFTTIAPPNWSLLVEGDSVDGAAIAPPSSGHPGGVYVLMADGSTRFVSDAIESGDMYSGSVRLGMHGRLAPGSKSPYGVWGEMGTRASHDEDDQIPH